MIIYEGPNTQPFNKYHKWYINVISHRQHDIIHKRDGYCERHHIVPHSLGGPNTSDNLVNLTAREHFIVHVLLTKFINGTNTHKMLSALSQMKGMNQRYINARLYDNSRKLLNKFKSYLNINTCEYEWFNVDPGDCYIREGHNKGTKYWYNPITNKHTSSKEYPGSNWIRSKGVTDGHKFWKHIKTGAITTSKDRPSDDWSRYSINAGIDNPSYKGNYGHIDHGQFITAAELATAVGNISATSIARVCNPDRDNGKRISPMTVCKSEYLQLLPFNPIGMTWKELGFYFIPSKQECCNLHQ
jgi:hypothetical protein